MDVCSMIYVDAFLICPFFKLVLKIGNQDDAQNQTHGAGCSGLYLAQKKVDSTLEPGKTCTHSRKHTAS
jgi:hypothetical protein